MADLLLILGVLLVALIAVVTLTEKFAKPMEAAQQTQLSRIAIALIMLLLVGRLLQHWLGG